MLDTKITKDTNMHTDDEGKTKGESKGKNQYVVHFNNHGEILRHYTWARTHRQAMNHAAHQLSIILGITPAAVANRMKRPNSVSVIELAKGV